MTPIEKLLVLVDEFPTRKRIDYDKNEDRVFCNEVLVALKHAAPDLRARLEHDKDVLSMHGFRATTPSTASSHGANIEASPEPQVAPNNHIPPTPQNTADSASGSGQKSDNAGKPLTGLAKLNAARKAAAASRRLKSVLPTGQNQRGQADAPPPAEPQTTA